MGVVIAAGLIASTSLCAVPAASAQDGAGLFQSDCAECHNGVTHPLGLVYNAAGNAAIITAVNAAGMGATGSAADFASIAAYLDTVKPTIALAPVSHDSPGTVIPLRDIIVSGAKLHAFLKIISEIVTVSPPAKGTASYTFGNGFNFPSTVNYTPFPGQSGVDSWTYQGTGARGTTTVRTASVNIAPATGATTPDLNQHGLTGSWYQEATSGQGIEVEVFPNPASGTGSTFVSWFTYDTVSGGAERQRWYTAQGPMASGQPSATLTIYQNVGGNFNAAPTTTAQAVGNAERDLLDGSALYHRRGLRFFRELVHCRHIGPRNDDRGQSNLRRAVRSLVHLCAKRCCRRGGWTTLVHRTGRFCAWLALDRRHDL
jgi:hypothetical protein